jgi:hypothetical protein
VSFPNFDDFGSGESGGDTTNPPPLGYGGPPDLSGFQQDDTSASYEDQASPTDYGGALGYAGPPAPTTTTTSETTYDQPTAQNTAPLGISGAPSSTDYSEPETPPSRPSRAEQSDSLQPATETPEQSLAIGNAGAPYFAAQDRARETLQQDVSQESGSLNGEWDSLQKRIDAYNNGGQYDPTLEGSLKGEQADLQRRTDEFKNRPDSYYNDRFQNPQMDGLLQNYSDAVNGVRDQRRSGFYTQIAGAEPFPDTLMSPQQGGALGADMLAATSPGLYQPVLDAGEQTFATPSGQQVVKKDDGSGQYSTWTIAGADDPQNVLYQDDKGNWAAISRDQAQQLVQQGTPGSRFTSVSNADSIAGDAVSTTGVQPSIGRTLQSAAFAATALALPVNPGDALLAGVGGEGASAIPGIGFGGVLKFNGTSFVANAILNGLPEHVPGTNLPIPELAQHPLAAFLDNPTGIIDTVRKAVIGSFNPQAPEVASLAQDVQDAFTQPDQDYWRQRGLQDAGFGSLLIGGLGLHNSPDGLLGFIAADPHNVPARYETLYQGAISSGKSPQEAAQVASQGIEDTVGNLMWTLNPWNPAYSWVTSPLLENGTNSVIGRAGQRMDTLGTQFATAPQVSDALLNRADQVAASLSRNPLALAVPQGAERITQMVADRAIQVPAARVQEFVQDFYSLALKVEEDQSLGATAGIKYLGPMGLTDGARQMADQMAAKWANLTGAGYLSLAGAVRDGFAATVPAAGNLAAKELGQRTGSTVTKAIETRMAELMALSPASPAVREYTYRAGTTAAQVGNDVLIQGGVKEAITQDLRRYYYDLAGVTLPADRTVAQRLVNDGIAALGNAVRASFLIAGAPAIALQKILDEALRASTQGVWGIFGVRPADMAITRAVSRFASERGMGVGDYLGGKSAVNRSLEGGVLPANNLLRDSQANGFWQGLRGYSPYGEKLGAGQRAVALNPVGMVNRAVDKFINTTIQSPTQHILLNAANKAYIEQAGGMKNIVETVIDRMNTTPGIASEDLVRYSNQLRAARSAGEFKAVLDDYTARYGALTDARGAMGGNGIPQRETPPQTPETFGQRPLYDLDNPPPPQPGTTYNQSPLFRDLHSQAPPTNGHVPLPEEPPQAVAMNGGAEAGANQRVVPQGAGGTFKAEQLPQIFADLGKAMSNVSPSAQVQHAAYLARTPEEHLSEWSANMLSGRGGAVDAPVPDLVRRRGDAAGFPAKSNETIGEYATRIRDAQGRAGASQPLTGDGGAKANGATKLPPLGRPLRPAERLAVANQGIENNPERYIAAVRGRMDSLPPEVRNYALNNYRNTLHKSFDPLDKTALRLLDENEIRVPYVATDDALARQTMARQGMGRDFDPGAFSTPTQHLAPGTDVGASLRPFEAPRGAEQMGYDAPIGRPGAPPLTRSGQYGGPHFGGTPVGGGAGAHRFDVPLPPPSFAQGRFPEQRALFGEQGTYTDAFPLGQSGPPPAPSGPAPFAPNADVVNTNANRVLIGQAGADYIAAQRAIPQRARQLGDAIIGNPADQTNLGSVLRNGWQVNGWSVLPAVLPFANFHIHTTQFWLRFFAEHPVMPVMIARALSNAGIDDYGYAPTDEGGKVGGALRMTTAGHLMDWGIKAQQYFTDLRRNPNGNNLLQQIEKNIAYNTVGNNAFVGAFPEETGLASGVVQSTTNPLLGKRGATDPRDILRERGSENWIEGGMNLAGVPRDISHALGGTGNIVSNFGMGLGVNAVDALGGDADLKPYGSTNQLPFVAPALAKQLGWDEQRTAFAVADITRHQNGDMTDVQTGQPIPLSADGQALMDAYRHMQDVGGFKKISPITYQPPDAGKPIYPTCPSVPPPSRRWITRATSSKARASPTRR